MNKPANIPEHVAVVMDGNGRWALERHLPRIEGHRRGIQALRELVKAARAAGVKHLTVFAFSCENWQRPADEVAALMAFFAAGLER
ncbi:MAG: undecaprenyl diphosphate synthase family protein, partial [Duodenibacillus sp.]|nr:undecaprenyl diphosphate synthase family protein [Duodenibacillus sp.]